MFLKDWIERYGVIVGEHNQGVRSVYVGDVEKMAKHFAPYGFDCKWELFHLTDYNVSSCAAGVYWLCKR